ncbi:carboxypeptidase-like regulatory domain-containing protein [Geopsychrobacter electrodiphilus]|uniref:carboxypeptidase-like regulatory domain-containing protein n=1 Tax=Geopsychrobacter electrodiphilus TaxID=225196 RepID=UPI0003768D37|nr:carboxypeptidase-like regulatory domain-containing protein [Geopsychrobacter electrodiphilus]
MLKKFGFCCLGILLSASLAQAGLIPVAGKVAVSGEGIAGVVVSAWPLATVSFGDTPPFQSAPSDKAGMFQLELPSGEYYFLAQNDQYFGFYGRNPVNVAGKGVDDLRIALPLRNPPRAEKPADSLPGVVVKTTTEGKPVAGVVLMVYPDLNSQLKGMGFGMSLPSDADGVTELSLGSGTYYIVARKRQSGGMTGPLSAGDYFGYYAGNPVTIKDTQVLSLGIDLVEVPQKVKQQADHLFGTTSIRGRVQNAVGTPVAGVRVLLYPDATMLNRPLYVSQPSTSKGEYVLSFPKGGTYFLAARNKLGGAPAPGELYGRYTGSQDSSIRIRNGQALEGINLLVEEMW